MEVSPGRVVLALILDALSGRSALFRLEQFFKDKDVGHLLGENIPRSKLNDDTLPSPEATLVTGITPQSTQADGYSEAEFARMLLDEIFTPDTIAVGYNNIRFDDEFVRHLLWRTFNDPYEWAWKDGRSRWDILDVIRMTRALRPEGINWPVNEKGQPSNQLEQLTAVNAIGHANAHDALADVEALISVTELLLKHQPRLFSYLLSVRGKKAIQKMANLESKQPFVYVSGRYDAQFNKATVAFPLSSAPNSNVLVYDLRYDPEEFINLSAQQLADSINASWQDRQKDGFVRVPVKVLQYNRSPAVAPCGVLDEQDGWKNIGLELATIQKHKATLLSRPDFAEKLREIFENKPAYPPAADPEAMLYDGFISGPDALRVETVRNSTAKDLVDYHPNFSDERLSPLFLHYKARNYPSTLSEDEVGLWEEWRAERLAAQLPAFSTSLQKLASGQQSSNNEYVLRELQLWAEAILPIADI